MSDEGGSNANQRDNKSAAIWAGFDEWIDEEPTIRRQRFEIVRAALHVHCEYISLIIGRIEDEDTPKQKFTAFLNVANRTKFINAQEQIPAANIFGILIDLFSTIPENQDETEINELLKVHLSHFLDTGLNWEQLFCSPGLVQSVYWQLLFTMRLALAPSEDEDEEVAIENDPNRPKLMFGCFILAILLGFAYANENAFAEKVPNFSDAEEITALLVVLVSSEQFRSLGQFLLIGLWVVVEYKAQGGRVSGDINNLTPEEIEHEREVLVLANAKLGLEAEDGIDDTALAEIQREWESFAVSLKTKGALVLPDGFKIVGRGGRRPKMPIRKRKADEAVPTMEVHPPPLKKPSRYQKKDPKALPKKHVRGRNIDKKQLAAPSNQPSTSAAVPSISARPRTTQRVIPTAEEAGLLPPIYMMHAKLFTIFDEECKRREKNGLQPDDRSRVQAAMFDTLDEVYLVNEKMKNAPPRTLTHNQKLVMTQYRKDWRRGDVKEVIAPPVRAVQDEVEEAQEVERVATPRSARGGRKPTKKWKRNQY